MKTKKSNTFSEALFCDYDGCTKAAKNEVTFLDHLWDKWLVCDAHCGEVKEILSRMLPSN